MNAPSRQAGFTLMETMVALFIIAMLAGSGAVLLSQTVEAGKQVDARTADLRSMEVAHAILLDDFAMLVPRSSTGADSYEPAVQFVGRRTGSGGPLFSFVRGGWTNPGGADARSDLQRVEYRVERGELIRTSWARPDPSGTTPMVERTLLTGLSQASVRYVRGGEWSDEWRADRISGDVPGPDAIELTLRFAEDDVLTDLLLTGVRS